MKNKLQIEIDNARYTQLSAIKNHEQARFNSGHFILA